MGIEHFPTDTSSNRELIRGHPFQGLADPPHLVSGTPNRYRLVVCNEPMTGTHTFTPNCRLLCVGYSIPHPPSFRQCGHCGRIPAPASDRLAKIALGGYRQKRDTRAVGSGSLFIAGFVSAYWLDCAPRAILRKKFWLQQRNCENRRQICSFVTQHQPVPTSGLKPDHRCLQLLRTKKLTTA